MAVYQRGKVWYTNFRFKGKRIRRPVGETSKREAQKREREIRVQLESEFAESLKDAMRARTFDEASERWLREEASAQSQKHHLRIVRDYIPDSTPLTQVPDLAMQMRTEMDEDGLAPRTINNRLSICSRILNLAFKRWRWLDAPLYQYIEKLSEKNTARDVSCSFEELQLLLDAIEHKESKRMATLAAFSGLRRGEIFRLGEDDWEPPYIIVKESKSGRGRRVPLPSDLHYLMDPLPFDLKKSQLRHYVDKARKKTGLWRIRYHDLRHIYATWIGNMPDTSAGQLMGLMGHRNLATTTGYLQPKDAVELVESFYRKVSSGEERPHKAATMH